MPERKNTSENINARTQYAEEYLNLLFRVEESNIYFLKSD